MDEALIQLRKQAEIAVASVMMGSGSLACRLDDQASWGREVNGENAEGCRRNLIDPGSCKVPRDETITLQQWRDQQSA